MSAFTQIQLERLPSPEVIQTLDYEAIVTNMIADLQARDPEYTALVESDPAIKLLEVTANRELAVRARINEAAKACMLAYAKGSDLVHLAALFGVQQMLISAGDPTTYPPTPPVYESDDRLRTRTQLSFEGYTTAGSIGSYVFFTLSASGQVKDVDVYKSKPGQVMVTVLSREGDGTPSQELLDIVFAALNAEEIRPLTDEVLVQAPTQIYHYNLTAKLYFYSGPDPEVVRQVALAKVTEYVTENHLLGHDITESGLHAALHQPGVQHVEIITPVGGTILVGSTEAAKCDTVTVTIEGVDE